MGLHGAGAGYDAEAAAADFRPAQVDHRILGLELPADQLKGLRHLLHGLDDFQTGQQIHVDLVGVAYETQNRIIVPGGQIGLDALILQPVHQVIDLTLGGPRFDNGNHDRLSFF